MKTNFNKKQAIIIILLLFAGAACRESIKTKSDSDPSARETIVNAKEINKKIKNGENVYYQNSTIIGDIDFTQSHEDIIETPSISRIYFPGAVIFSNCTFQGKITASKENDEKYTYCRFDKNITFNNCTFQNTVNFTESVFDHLVLFRKNEFQDSVKFQGALFKFKESYFHNNRFMAHTNFNYTIFEGKSSFLKSEFYGGLLFQSSLFKDNVNLGAIVIHKKSDISLMRCRGTLNMNFADFRANCNFNSSRFYDELMLFDIKAEKKITMENSFFYFPYKKENWPDTSIISLKNSRLIESRILE